MLVLSTILVDAFVFVVKLMERQNAFLEQVLGTLTADRHEKGPCVETHGYTAQTPQNTASRG